MGNLWRVALLALALCTSAHSADVFRPRNESAQICRDESMRDCRIVGKSTLMEQRRWGTDPWRVVVLENGNFESYWVHKDEVEPAIGKDGKQLDEICVPGGGGIYNRTEVGPNGQVYLKRYQITTTCKDGKSYSTTKPLN